MTLADQARIAGLLPWVPIVLFVVGGLLAVWLVNRQPRSDRADRAIALRLGGLLAVIAAGAVLFFAAALSGAFGGSAAQGITAGVPIAIGAAALVFLSGLAVYALLARPRIGAWAVVGIIVGPLLLGGSTWLATRWRDQVSWSRYTFLHVSIDAVETGGVRGGSVLGPVTLAVTVSSDAGIRWSTTTGGHRYPFFRAHAAGDPWALCEAKVWAPAGSPSRYEPGGVVRYSLEFTLPQSTGPEPCTWAPGPWWLDFVGAGLRDGDAADDSHIVQTPFQVGLGAQ